MSSILEELNKNFKYQPLIYVCIEVERALGLENLLDNYHIICYDDSPILDLLKEQGISVVSIAREGLQNDIRRSTGAMLVSDFVRNQIQKITKGAEFYLQTFHPTKTFDYHAQNCNCIMLNNPTKLSEIFENKLTAAKLLLNSGIRIPEFEIVDLANTSFGELQQSLKTEKLVIQTQEAHTGEGTYIIATEAEYDEIKLMAQGSKLKAMKFIKGDTWTINGCVTKAGALTHGLSYQITGIPELTALPGSTVGNDWSKARALNSQTLTRISKITVQVGELLKSRGYLGLYGVDLMLEEGTDQVYVIEINARQTANIPMQSNLEQRAGQTPLALTHLATFLEQEIYSVDYGLNDLDGAQVFNRAKTMNQIKSAVKLGSYRLQSDNAAIDWEKLDHKTDVIYLDEESDLPLTFQKSTYNVQQIETGFQLLTGAPGLYTKNAELCRLQFTEGAIIESQLKPWILQALTRIENLLTS